MFKKIFKNCIVLLSVFTLCLGISCTNVYAEESKPSPEMGKYCTTLDSNLLITAIDVKNGYWLIRLNNKLCWCDSLPTAYADSNTSKFPINLITEAKIRVYEDTTVGMCTMGYTAKVEDVLGNWLKIKTQDGYDAYANSEYMSIDKNNYATYKNGEDMPLYFTAKLTPLSYVKTLTTNEHIEAIDVRKGNWLIAEHGKLCWCDSVPTKYLTSNTSNFPIYLSVETNIPIYEAGIVHYYRSGERIQVEKGSVNGWWKVKTPEGDNAWVSADYTSYDAAGNLISISNYAPAYFTSR